DIEVVNEVKGDNRRYSGGIGRNQPLADVLELLEANGINHFKITGRKVTVLP
ncbi:MAG: anti-sigma factor, partial [Bacteroidetes bacterium]|nr:anti-sigma factor [Bacteroidota bacterium]